MASTSQFSSWQLPPPSRSNLQWFYAMAVFLLLTASVHGRMHINKCCGAKEQLNDYLDTCIPYEGTVARALPHKTSTASFTTTEEVMTTELFTSTALPTTTELLTSSASSSTTMLPTTLKELTTLPPGDVILEGELPYWIDPNLTVLETHSHLPLENGAAWAGARATIGHRPCPFSDTQYAATMRREMYQLLANGSLLLPMWRTHADGTGRTEMQVALPPDDWCMDRVENGYFVILSCPCELVTCINRCCSSNSMYEAQKNRHKLKTKCKRVDNATPFRKDPVFYHGLKQLNINNGGGQGETGAEDGGGVVYTELFAHSPECNSSVYGKHLLNSDSDEGILGYWIQRNGSVIIENFNNGRAFERHHVCHVEVKMNGIAIPDILFCNKRIMQSNPDQENVFYSLLFLLGAFFLLLTLLVHALVPELRRSAHAKALMCHCASLLVASLTLTVGHLHHQTTQPFCSISAFLVQFFFLSTFFWLNVMCFDLSWTSGAMRRRRMPSVGGDRSRRFLWYSLYAWGCPALISAVTLFMEFAPDHIVPPDLSLLPNIGARRCWFDTKYATFVYYYGPVALLLVVNLVLFAVTVVHIIRATSKAVTEAHASDDDGDGDTINSSDECPHGKEVSHMASKTTAKTAATKSPPKGGDRQKLIVFTKLFCLMGVTWVTEIVSWLAGEETFAFWYITDAVNLLRGVLIFVFFCCKPVAMRPLKARMRSWAQRCCPAALRLGASKKHPRISITTLEISQSMSDLMDSTPTGSSPTAGGTLSAKSIKEDTL